MEEYRRLDDGTSDGGVGHALSLFYLGHQAEAALVLTEFKGIAGDSARKYWSLPSVFFACHLAVMIWEKIRTTSKPYASFESEESIIDCMAAIVRQCEKSLGGSAFGTASVAACRVLFEVMKERFERASSLWCKVDKTLLSPQIRCVVDMHIAKNSNEPLALRCRTMASALSVFQKVRAKDCEQHATQFLVQNGQGGQSQRRGTASKLSLRKFSLAEEDGSDTSQKGTKKNMLFGRDAEAGKLVMQALALKETTRSSATVFEGESGSGKSALLDYIGEVVGESMGYSRVIRVEGAELHSNTALHLFGHVLEHCFERAVDTSTGEMTAIGCQNLMEQHGLDPGLLPLLSAMLPFEVEELASIEELSAQARYSSTNKLLLEILRNYVKEMKTVVILIDDLQWGDQQSIAVLVEALAVEGLLVVMSVRSDAVSSDELSVILGMGMVKLESLPPLSGDAFSKFLEETVDALSLDDDVTEEVRKRAGNNLFVASIVMTGMKDRGALKIDEDGHCCLDPDGDLDDAGGGEGEEMEGVSGLVADRFALLGRREQELLQTASVFGQIAPVEMLARVHMSVLGGSEADLLQTAQSLFKQKFLRRDKKRPDYVEFDSLLVQQAIYERMLVSQREMVHVRIVDEIELDEERLKNDFEVLINHCKRSGDLGRTRKYLLKAG
ncbi:hypothetical protein TeGR_g7392 [Tetraparma gracilis]|uniref:Orc1-like AAA ATPase domain-containing protein n=1 Tax=Tetraparma gracilis TaxID=2962635 RepID=A0ABQ6M7A7_9STRA|nr:hypothetical protein TeGR_g7392 [Tetraparma gracilis]